MASSKKNKNTTPQDQALAAKRVAFVKSKPDLAPVEARTRFFVQTRAAELQAKGVEVTKERRQQLRQKFASGDVQRQGFYTPADIARASAAKSSIKSDSKSGSGQNLDDYKQSTGGDQAVRVGRAATQPAPKGNPLGVSNRFAGAVKNPAKDFSNSILGGAIKGAYKMAAESAESFNATFINPTINLAGKAIGKKPNLRQAGPKEAVFNTAMLALDIASAGQSRTAAAALGPVTREALAVRAAQKAPGFVESAVAYGSNKAGQVFGKSFPGGKVVARAENLATKVESAAKTTAPTKSAPKLKASTPAKSSTPKAGVKAAGSPDLAGYSKMKDIDIDLKFGNAAEKTAAKKADAALKAPKPKATPKAKPAVAPKATPKAKVANVEKGINDLVNSPEGVKVNLGIKADPALFKTPKPKAAPKAKQPTALSDLLSGPKPAAKPKATPKPKATAKPAATAKPKAAPKEINRFADAWDDTPVDMSKVKFEEFAIDSAKPYGTAKRSGKAAPAPKVEAPKPAATPKPKAKTTKPKANAKAAFNTSVENVKSAKSAPKTKLTFKSQAEYNQFLSTGGKERLRQMSPDVRRAFENVNEDWIKGASATRKASQTQAESRAARAVKQNQRYQKARPALQAKFNQALLNRQQRQLLAKIAPKK